MSKRTHTRRNAASGATRKPRVKSAKPSGPFGERCYEMFRSALKSAPPELAEDVTVWAMHEIFVLARAHPSWSEQRVWAEALFNAMLEWDLWWEP